MRSISPHIMPLVINSLGCGDTHTHARIHTIRTGSILRNQACAGLWPARAWFKNHLLYVDNFYTSAELLLDLLDIGVYCTGTVRTNRKHFPKELVPSSKALPMGNYRFAVSERFSITAAWWKDRRDVFMMSSLHEQATEMVLKRPKGSKDKTEVPSPSMVVDYNQHMGGVDLTDQHISYYSMSGRKTLKWWKKVLWRLLDIAIINSWIIYRSNYPDSSINSQKLFRLKLVEEMVQPLLTLRSSPICPTYLHGKERLTTAEDTRLMGKHFPYISAERKRCLVCSKKLSPTTGKRNDKRSRIIVPPATSSFVWESALKFIIHRQSFN